MNNNLSISQNFLVNNDFVNELINKSSINNNDLVIEIGSGKGIITEILAIKVKEVISIEADPLFASKLLTKFKDYKNIKIINQDFLKYTLPNKPFKIFSNPPFNLSADILNKLLKFPNTMSEAYLILQDKTVERFSREGNQISTLWKPLYEISIIQKISKNEFRPVPNVNIVFCKFEKRKTPMIDVANYQLYRDFVIYGYNQWKPTLLQSFNKVFTKEQLKTISKKCNLDNLKPSETKINQWIDLFDAFQNHVLDKKKLFVKGYEIKQINKQKDMVKRHRTTL